MTSAPVAAARSCSGCGTEVAGALLRCPGCRRLSYTAELRELAGAAREAEAAGDRAAALERWREALELLPDDAAERGAVVARISSLGESAFETAEERRPQWAAAGGAVGAAALLLWKFKFAAVFVVTKAKFLVLGLTKGGTLLSMLAAFGVYWTAWGWRFAAGLVASIYIHEMGHVATLRRYGIKASAPMFIPGLGAVVRMKQLPATVREDARVGLAGPLWGLGAACAAYATHLASGLEIWAAVARVGAWLNLFNLLPIWQLDGGRAFRAMARRQRWIAVGVLVALWLATSEGLLVLLACAGGLNALTAGPDEPDHWAMASYLALAAVLALMTRIVVNPVAPL